MATDVEVALLRDMIADVGAEVREMKTAFSTKLDNIHREARTTNGRVSAIEDEQRRKAAVRAAIGRWVRWAIPTMVTIAATIPLWSPHI